MENPSGHLKNKTEHGKSISNENVLFNDILAHKSATPSNTASFDFNIDCRPFP